jgi:transcription antitermination factor NusG
VKKNWYALYTKSRSEKKVNQELIHKSIDCYLPLEKKLKLWSDRKKWVEEPLIRSYIFVYIEEEEIQKALNTPGVVNVIRFGGKLAKVQNEHIEIMKSLLSGSDEYEISSENFEPGEQIEITHGSMKGFFGELVHHLNKYKVLIRISSINQNLLIRINPSHLKKV